MKLRRRENNTSTREPLMDSGTKKMNNVLIKSEWSKNTKAIFATPERWLFSPAAQDIMRERIKSRAYICIFLNVSTYFGGYHIDKPSICTPAHPEHAHVRSLNIVAGIDKDSLSISDIRYNTSVACHSVCSTGQIQLKCITRWSLILWDAINLTR